MFPAKAENTAPNKNAGTIEKLAVARYDIGKNITSAWDKEKEPDQWKALIDIITERNPNKQGINISENLHVPGLGGPPPP